MPLPAIIPIIAAGLSAAGGIAQASAGRKTQEAAQLALDSYQRQDLTNYAENLKVRTEAQDFKAQQYDKTFATALDVLQSSGNFTSATNLVQQNLTAKRELANDIQQQRNRLDQLKLQEQARIRSLQEQRERDDLAGIGAQYQFGAQQKAQGQQAAIGAFGQLASLGIQGGFGGGNVNTQATGTPLAQNAPTVAPNNTNPVFQQGTPDANMYYNQYYGG